MPPNGFEAREVHRDLSAPLSYRINYHYQQRKTLWYYVPIPHLQFLSSTQEGTRYPKFYTKVWARKAEGLIFRGMIK